MSALSSASGFDGITADQWMSAMTLDFSDYEHVLDLLRYQSFNAEAVLKRLKDLNGGNWTVTKKHISVIIYYFVTRGTKANPKKMKAEGEQIFASACQNLGVAFSNINSDSVTIGRIASLFASEVARLMKIKAIVPRVTITGLPNYLCFPQAATLLHPKSPYWAHFIEWIEAFDVLINTKTNRVDIPKAKAIALTSSEQSLLPIAVREAIVRKIEAMAIVNGAS